jgi:hypothetical protein
LGRTDEQLPGCVNCKWDCCLRGLLPLIYAAAYKPDRQLFLGLAATAIRLLLMIAGSAIVIIVAKVNILWFALWIGIFYLVTLVLEIGFALRSANSNNIIRDGKV